MRYLSLPRRARSSSLPTNELGVHRSQPTTCVLSLANVTASLTSSASSVAPAAMDIDDDALTMSVALSDIGNTDGVARTSVAFPSGKRTHSLLRATPSAAENESLVPHADGGESKNASDHPPRKRTRTCALSSPVAPRSQRCSSTPTPISLPLVCLSGSSTPLPVASAQSCIRLMSMKPSPLPTRVSAWRRRRMLPGETRVLRYLYRTLVYGLQVRKQENSRSFPSSDSSLFDSQDALLAQHLRIHLLANGTSPSLLFVDTEAVAEEGRPTSDLVDSGLAAMLIDDDSPISGPFLHPHIHPTTVHTVWSYQQLVATLHIRRYLHPRRPSTKLSARRPTPLRRPSGLSQSISFN